jgi:hypothetical protein
MFGNAEKRGVNHSVLLHELQHAVQQREGFTPGGTGYGAAHEFPDVASQLGMTDQNAINSEMYRRIAGEVEARDVQSRMNMSDMLRAKTPPYSSQGVPAEQMLNLQTPEMNRAAIAELLRNGGT